MKTYVAAFVIIGVSLCVKAQLTDEQKQKLENDRKTCTAETGVDSEVIQKAREGTFADDAKLKSFLFCVSKRIGFQNDAGDAQTEVIRQKVGKALNDPELANQLIEKCLIDVESPEEGAFLTYKCYWENTPNHLSIF